MSSAEVVSGSFVLDGTRFVGNTVLVGYQKP